MRERAFLTREKMKIFFSLYQTMCTSMLIFSVDLLNILLRLSLIFVFDDDESPPPPPSVFLYVQRNYLTFVYSYSRIRQRRKKIDFSFSHREGKIVMTFI